MNIGNIIITSTLLAIGVTGCSYATDSESASDADEQSDEQSQSIETGTVSSPSPGAGNTRIAILAGDFFFLDDDESDCFVHDDGNVIADHEGEGCDLAVTLPVPSGATVKNVIFYSSADSTPYPDVFAATYDNDLTDGSDDQISRSNSGASDVSLSTGKINLGEDFTTANAHVYWATVGLERNGSDVWFYGMEVVYSQSE